MSEFQIEVLVQSYLEDITSKKGIHRVKRLAPKSVAQVCEFRNLARREASHTNPHSGWKEIEGSEAGEGARGPAARSRLDRGPDPFWHKSPAAQILAQQSLHWSDQPVLGF